MFSCRLVLQSCWFASSVASAAGGEMLLLFYELAFAMRVCSIALLLFIVTTGWSHGVYDAVCVSMLRVRCECFLRVVVWV